MRSSREIHRSEQEFVEFVVYREKQILILFAIPGYISIGVIIENLCYNRGVQKRRENELEEK